MIVFFITPTANNVMVMVEFRVAIPEYRPCHCTTVRRSATDFEFDHDCGLENWPVTGRDRRHHHHVSLLVVR
jgi:hypothetical protein